MYSYCKLCGECLLLWIKEPEFSAYKCPLCPEYSVLLIEPGHLPRWEDLIVGNMRLIYIDNEFVIQSKDKVSGRMNNLHSFPANELTHELAVQWVNKLKNYLVFQ